MSNTAILPTDLNGNVSWGPFTVQEAAAQVLGTLAGSYAEDEKGKPLSESEMFAELRENEAYTLERGGYPSAAAKLRKMSKSEMEKITTRQASA